ncbi:histidine kinase [Bifidobacterium sp. DSM 109957]|uniref:Histidine kinase n=1 Tax=Bifidobacterium oedipodis TaxID=2675322 RepID=A0A7Y0HRL0_9BIFI|nr:histidine kinase [Bifidobacterium sp. DSM 109957]
MAWVRLAVIVLTCLYGVGAIGYIFLWVFLPAGDPVAAARAQAASLSVAQAPLSRGNATVPLTTPLSPLSPSTDPATAADAGPTDAADFPSQSANSYESLAETLKRAPKPALIALAGIALIAIALLLVSSGVGSEVVTPLLLALAGVGVAWMYFSDPRAQLPAMLGGIALIIAAWMLYVSNAIIPGLGSSPRRIMLSGLIMLLCVVAAVLPSANALVQKLTHEQALKEREEERADMTAHLHDGVLQTLALIQLHAEDPTTVFTLARGQERELREWLYQERSTSDRSVNAGLKQIAAAVEDDTGKAIEVVNVGDARPSAQTDALLDATRQALVNAAMHGGEPISLYCEAGPTLVEVFVRDHGNGFDVNQIPADRLGIRESIIGRIKRRGGTVEIVSKPGWGTEVRMHMPIAETAANEQTKESQ